MSTKGLASILALGAWVERFANGFTKMAEGPLWWPEQGCLIISDIVGDASWRVWPDGRHEIFRQPSEHANGRTWDRDGTMLTAEPVSRTVTRLVDGCYRPVATHYQGKRFNSPNDVIAGPGGIGLYGQASAIASRTAGQATLAGRKIIRKPDPPVQFARWSIGRNGIALVYELLYDLFYYAKERLDFFQQAIGEKAPNRRGQSARRQFTNRLL